MGEQLSSRRAPVKIEILSSAEMHPIVMNSAVMWIKMDKHVLK